MYLKLDTKWEVIVKTPEITPNNYTTYLQSVCSMIYHHENPANIENLFKRYFVNSGFMKQVLDAAKAEDMVDDMLDVNKLSVN